MPVKPRIAVSACLLGEKVRYDGGDKREPCVAEVLALRAELLPVCPEVEAGLGVPRPPIGFTPEKRLTILETGRDITAAMQRSAEALCAALEKDGVRAFVFKARSPSCGLKDVPAAGRGLFAEVFTRRNPGLPVADEEELRDPARLEEFLREASAWTA